MWYMITLLIYYCINVRSVQFCIFEFPTNAQIFAVGWSIRTSMYREFEIISKVSLFHVRTCVFDHGNWTIVIEQWSIPTSKKKQACSLCRTDERWNRIRGSIHGQPWYVTDILRDVFKYHRMIHDTVNIRKCSWDFCPRVLVSRSSLKFDPVQRKEIFGGRPANDRASTRSNDRRFSGVPVWN